MKNISKKIWDKIITSGLKSIVAGICFVIVLSAGVYFASAHFSKPISTPNELKSAQEVADNKQNDAQGNTEQKDRPSDVTPTATEVKAENPKIISASSSPKSCNDGLKAQALKDGENLYNTAVASENAREQKALDDLKVARDERLAKIGSPSSSPEWDTLMKEQQQKLSALYAQENSEFARLPHDSEGRIINSADQIDQINAKYDPLIKAVNDEYGEKRRVLTSRYTQVVQDIYKQDQITATEIVKESKMKLAELASTHQAKIDQINNTCY